MRSSFSFDSAPVRTGNHVTLTNFHLPAESISHSALVFLLLVWQDFIYHGIAAFFYLSASVALAGVTLEITDRNSRNYKLDVSAVVSRDATHTHTHRLA